MDRDDLPGKFQQPVMRRAVEELKMISQSDIERERYESRRKAQLDQTTMLNFARMEGRNEERFNSEINRLHLCERFLKRPETPAEQLSALSLTELTRKADELEKQVMERR